MVTSQQPYRLQDLLDIVAPGGADVSPSGVARHLNAKTGTSYKIVTVERMLHMGLSYSQADVVATAYSLMPYEVWPQWLADDTAEACYDPKPEPLARYAGATYRPGGLQRAVLEAAELTPGQPLAAASLRVILGRPNPSQLYGVLKHMAARGVLQIASEPGQPLRYMPSAPVPVLREQYNLRGCSEDFRVPAYYLDRKLRTWQGLYLGADDAPSRPAGTTPRVHKARHRRSAAAHQR